MTKFRIDWRVDLDASSPHEAACFASEIQRQESTATVFSVEDKQTGQIHVVDLHDEHAPKGTNLAARMPADTTSLRSLRPGRTYKTRDGKPVEITDWELDSTNFPLGIRIDMGDGTYAVGCHTKTGLHPQTYDGGKPHPLDVVEANPTIQKWIRVYDQAPLNENGKQVVGGKEFAAERGLHWYIFNTEQEAKAQLRGVRAVFPIEYTEGRVLARRRNIYIDRDATKLAVDVTTVQDCDYYIESLKRDIEFILPEIQFCQDAPKTIADLMDNRDLSIHIPRNFRQALFYKKRGILELQDQRRRLSHKR